MGNSCIIDMSPGQMARTLTNLPGTLVYMPPEALDDRSRYGPSLDIFSFRHLALFSITQVAVAIKNTRVKLYSNSRNFQVNYSLALSVIPTIPTLSEEEVNWNVVSSTLKCWSH